MAKTFAGSAVSGKGEMRLESLSGAALGAQSQLETPPPRTSASPPMETCSVVAATLHVGKLSPRLGLSVCH